MIHFKHKKGFTLLETIIAMAVVATIVTALFTMQSTILRRVNRLSFQLERIMIMRLFLYEARRNTTKIAGETSIDKNIKNPPLTLRYQRSFMEEHSSLNSLNNIYKEQVIAHWEEQGVPQTQTMTAFIYSNPPQDPKAEGVG